MVANKNVFDYRTAYRTQLNESKNRNVKKTCHSWVFFNKIQYVTIDTLKIIFSNKINNTAIFLKNKTMSIHLRNDSNRTIGLDVALILLVSV